MPIRKKGISPVVATVLLLLLVVIIAVIILLWSRSFLAEKVQKNMGNGEVPIEDFCKEVGFSAEVTAGGDVTIENTKNIPIFGIKVLKVGKGSKKELGSKDFGSTVDAVKAGQTYTFSSVFSGGAAAGEDVLVLPTLLGFAKEQRKTYTCDEDFGVPTKVIS